MEFRRPLELACGLALRHLETLEDAPVAATATAGELRERLALPLPDCGTPAEQVIAEMAGGVEGGLIGIPGGRFFGWVIGGATPAALAADWLTSAWDQNAGLYVGGPAAAVVEEVAGGWLKQLLGLPDRASFAFVTGCQMAHATCLAAARHAVLIARGWDVEEQGLAGAPRIRVVTSEARHSSVERALRLLGLGRSCVQALPADPNGRLSPEALAASLDDSPTIVILQAGDLNLGAYDPFLELIPIARRRRAWVHVDGAFGLWANANPRYRHLLAGVEAADSWATDGHKWLNVPYDCGYAFVSDPEPHRASMSIREPYLSYQSEVRDQMDWNPEFSRRARGFATYAALRELGREGVAALVERCCAHAKAVVEGVGRLAGAEVLWLPTINQGLVAFGDDRRTDRVVSAVLRSGEAFFQATTWRGRRAMRVSVCNWQTSARDVERAVRAVERALLDTD